MEAIRNTHGETIGFLSEDSANIRALDSHGMPIATYSKISGYTNDKHGVPIGRGNQLMRFFPL